MEKKNSSRIRFLGAAGTVTGSKYLLTTNQSQILVDCGLFQGLKELRLKNWDRFPIDPQKIDGIVLTHAHIDHSGLIPLLIKEGFAGKVYCTPATLELCRILLPDTGYLQEEEAWWLNKKKMSKHSPALALFTKEDAEKALKQFVPIEYDTPFFVGGEFKVELKYAGHILGAAMALIETDGIKIAFSGDLGRLKDSVMRPPACLPPVDYLVVESTYGNRKHPKSHPIESLEKIINETIAKKGVVLIPSFAVGRAQTIMHFVSELIKSNRIPKIPVYLNSPMAESVTHIFCRYQKLHQLSENQCHEFQDVIDFVKTSDESRRLNEKKGPMIIISASGMLTGGRILHHLRAFAPDSKNAIVLVGYQAVGTRGRSIEEGAKAVKFHGEMIPIKASVYSMPNMSAHADGYEIISWLQSSKVKPQKVFITHGEVESAFEMKKMIEQEFSWNCFVPQQDQEFALESSSDDI
ncbi:MAG: MBL fold metallo-hydrolase [Bdellovibrionales bacterium]|nr:MBL fold metallo-hydrolase [Bdellovibrionales bacterium]